MPLRIVFGSRDLQQVRLAAAPDLLWELVLSLHRVQDQPCGTPELAWRAEVGHRMARHERFRRQGFPLLRELVPPRGDFPDFLTPTPVSVDLDAGCAAVASIGPARFGADIAAAFADRPASGWVRSLAAGDREPVGQLVTALRHGYQLLVDPVAERVRQTVAADRVHRMRGLAEHGVGQLLAGLPGVAGWDGAMLTVRYPRDRTVELGGRGLTLVPSYFCTGMPVTLIDPGLPPMLVYPARSSQVDQVTLAEPPAALSRLLGHTRAACLTALARPHTTSSLACQLDLSLGTASRQTAVLRDSGLITSTRDGAAVVHRVTTLGTELITQVLLNG